MLPFKYDRFQEEAVAAIRGGISAFVSAPTGAGKTVIAEVAVEEALKTGGMAIYTAPIKALSNQKFRDFHARYGEKAGILTGDVTLNPEAPLLIMTTEIYRNSLFEGSARFSRCRWVIFDEVHYLDDPERGTVWEEALLLTPRETEILALSATIPNAQQLAAWIEKIHGRPVKVIQESHRPIPLKFGFQCQNDLFWDIDSLKQQGYRGMERAASGSRRPFRMRRSRGGRFYFKSRPGGYISDVPRGRANRAEHLLLKIQQHGHLPCLYFAFSRRRVEDLAQEFTALNLVDEAIRRQLLDRFDALCGKYQIQHERSAMEMRDLVARGVAYHHAGLFPTLKEVVEILFSSRLIQVIVTTETFALGVNMPARSVVLDTVLKRADGPRSLLRVRELSQMAGRAGRRGMDEAGFVYLRINPWETPIHEVERLLHGRPEEVSSRFHLTYATVLNLYRHYGQDLLPFYQKTLHAFQAPAHYQREAFSLIEREGALLQEMGYLPPQRGQTPLGSKGARSEGSLTAKGEFAVSLYGYELFLSELFVRGLLEGLEVTRLGILLLALVYEPRRGIPPPRLPRRYRELIETATGLLEEIHRQEKRHQIRHLSKGPVFHLSEAMERWLAGAEFDKVVEIAKVAEGEMIRYLRMTLQLARGLAASRMAGKGLKQRALELAGRINRDPVDAEAELRRSLT